MHRVMAQRGMKTNLITLKIVLADLVTKCPARSIFNLILNVECAFDCLHVSLQSTSFQGPSGEQLPLKRRRS